MRLALGLAIFSFLGFQAAAEPVCGASPLDPASYASIGSQADFRERISNDLMQYGTLDGTLLITCFAQDYTVLGDNLPFGTRSTIRFGTEVPHNPLYHLSLLVSSEQTDTGESTSLGYGVQFTSIDGSLVFVDFNGNLMEAFHTEHTIELRTCSASLFEPYDFRNVRNRSEIDHLIEESIFDYIENYGEVDWLCFAEAFVAMGEDLPNKLFATLHLDGANPRGTYRFEIRNLKMIDLLLPIPRGPSGAFTSIVRVENPRQMAIVEGAEDYRWLELE